MAREVDKIARRGDDAFGALHHFDAERGQRHVALTPLHQIGAQFLFEVADLHRQRRLRHGTGLRRPAEMPVLRQSAEISQLPQGDHVDKIFLSIVSGNTIRPY